MALLQAGDDVRQLDALRARIEYVSLSMDPAFQDVFMDELSFGREV